MRNIRKSIMGFSLIVLFFILSYISYEHIDNSYMMNEPDHVVELEAANDSLETLVEELEEELEDLKDEDTSDEEVQKDELEEELEDLKEEETSNDE